MKAYFCFLVLSLVALGCRPSKHSVAGVEVVGATVEDNPALGLSPGQIQAMCTDILRRDPHFKVLPAESGLSAGGPVKLVLELAFTREEQRPDRPGTYAEVGASMSLRRRTNEGTTRYDVTGMGEEKLKGDTLSDRQEGLRTALKKALVEAVVSAQLQLDALDKSAAALTADLKSNDARVRSFALHALAERKEAAAVPGLVAKLQDPDLDEVRRAVGGLVQIGDPRAVPALIELMRGKDLAFTKELVFAVSAIGGEEAQAFLYTVAQGHEQLAMRQVAQQALDELRERSASGAGAQSAALGGGRDRTVGAP
jgi:hypothetical protein